MKTLFLVRHAKSSWNDPALPDKERPLNDRGKRDARRLGKRLAKGDLKPDVILSSPARRALATARIIARRLDFRVRDIQVNDRLYAVEADDLLQVIRGLDDKVKSAMLVGHNPELTELAQRLSDEIAYMPTCAVAVLAFEAKSWSRAGRDEPASVALRTPKRS